MKQPKTKETIPSQTIVSDFFENLGNKSYFLALSLIIFIAFFVFKDFLLLKNVFQFKDIGSDTLNGMYPYYHHYADYIQKNGWPQWSFSEGMGQGILSGFLRDPFQLITMLIGPQSMPKIFIYIIVLEIIIAGSIFYFFLKALKTNNYSAIIGTLLFSFCGFMIIGSCWYLFTFEALNVALLLLGFERIYQKNNWFLFSLGIFLAAISFPVNLFTYGVFILFYGAFRFLQENDFDKKKFFGLYGKLIMAGAIGLLISGPFLLENIFQVLESPRGSGGDSYFDKLANSPMFATSNKVEFGTSVMRMLSSDILGSGNSFSGIQNFLEAPFSYCGLISLLLMSQIFPLISKNLRKWYIALLIIWLTPTFFPYFRYAFWLFSGDYYRAYSFFLSLVFILFSVHALDLILKHKKVNLIALISTLILWLILSSISYKSNITYQNGQQGIQELKSDDTIAFFVRLFLVFYAILIFMLGKSKNITNIKYILLIMVVFELTYISQFSANRRSIVSVRDLKEKIGYNDYSIEAIKYIKENDKSFFRVDKSYFSGGAMHGSITDHKVHSYYGTSSYNSFAQINYINYMRAYNVIDKNNEFASRWVDGLISRPFLESLNHVKYVLTKEVSKNPVWLNTHDSVAKFGDVVVLKSKFNLPLGYTYNQYISQTDFDLLSSIQKDLVSLKACVLSDQELSNAIGLKRLSLKDTLELNKFTWDYLKNSVDSLKNESFKTVLFSENKIEGNISVSKNKIMYLSFPKDKGWHLKLDGKETETILVNNGMTGIYLSSGNHSINLEYHSRFLNKGLILTLVGILIAGIFWFFNRKNKVAII